MLKILALFGRKPGWSEDEFLAHYTERHGPLVAGSSGFTKHCARYVQNYAVRRAVGPAIEGNRTDRDAISELWFENVDAIHATYADAEYLLNVRPDELRFADFPSASTFVCMEHEIEAFSSEDEPDKMWAHQPRHRLFVFRSPRPGLQSAALQDAWLSSTLTIRGIAAYERYVKRYVQSHVTGADAADLPSAEAGQAAVIDEFSFADGAAAVSFWDAFRRDPQILSLAGRWTNTEALQLFFAAAHTVFEVKSH
jgi:uncharacterized protein (TIGR02118 family)